MYYMYMYLSAEYQYMPFILIWLCNFIDVVNTEGGEVCIIERLFSSSLVAVVELAHPRKLRACHFKVAHDMYS